jgi:3-oxoacyl-[acyl-carrier-protein] synthase-1
MIVAHGNGTRQGDVSEARALRGIFGAAPPPVTAFKWAFGHLLAASGIIETVLALAALRGRTVPGSRRCSASTRRAPGCRCRRRRKRPAATSRSSCRADSAAPTPRSPFRAAAG